MAQLKSDNTDAIRAHQNSSQFRQFRRKANVNMQKLETENDENSVERS